jgi:hypothetical protein
MQMVMFSIHKIETLFTLGFISSEFKDNYTIILSK